MLVKTPALFKYVLRYKCLICPKTRTVYLFYFCDNNTLKMVITHGPLRYAHNEGHTDVCYSETGDNYITCGSDGDMRIWSADINADPIHNCVGEFALAVRQSGSKIYVSTGSNDIQILTFPEGEREGVLDRFVAPINNIFVAKDGQHIALAAEEMEVKLISLDDSNKKITTFSGLMGPCLSVALCPKIEYIASSCGDGKLRIWKISDKELVYEAFCFPKVNSFANAKALCRIDFQPTRGNYLAYPDKEKIVLLRSSDWSQSASLSFDGVDGDFSIVQFSNCGNYLAGSTVSGDFVIWEISSEKVVNYSKHPDAKTICSFTWNPKGNGEIIYTDVEGQLGIMSGCIDKISDGTETAAENELKEDDVDFGDVQFEDDDEDNENAISLENLKKQFADTEEPELEFDRRSSKSSTPRPRTPEVPLQAPFMPSSTPEHLNPRYMCWNEIGVIRCYGSFTDDDDTSKSIEVDFHDSTFHNSMMMQNFQNYTMGTLSSTALAVGNSSQLNVIPLGSRSKEWVLNMEDGEEIILLANSENLVCLGMSNYIVKVCSTYGTQRVLFSVPGPLVSMAAFKNLILVAYHTGAVRKGDQCIGIKLIRIENLTVEAKELGGALGPESTLLWLGFSDLGTPALMDSAGMLSLQPLNAGTWIPLCDTTKHRKSPADGFFVTAVYESNQTVVGIKCKGTVYPGFTPRPTMCELPLEAPFAEIATDKSQLESNLFTYSVLNVNDTEKKFKEAALKTFALACRSDLDQRAVEFMEILGNPQILTLALKYASRLDKKRLVEKLMELAKTISEEADENYQPSMDVVTPDLSEIKVAKRRLTLGKTPKQKQRNSNIETPPPANNHETPEILTPKTNLEESASETFVDTQESLFSEEEVPRGNPFLKSLKKGKEGPVNPLSLTDKFAGVNYEKESRKTTESGEKRKQPDTESDKQKEKQRKLDRFMFLKRN